MTERILYSMCWEDHEAITDVVEQGDRVLMVASAGDLALSALSKEPREVVAVDSNPDQLAMLHYKALVIRTLSYSEAMLLLGLVEHASERLRKELLDRVIKKADEETAAWIEANEAQLVQGIFFTGQFERYLHRFVRWMLPLVVRRKTIEEFLQSKSLDEQRRIYQEQIDTWTYRFLFQRFFGRWYMKRKGRHPDLLKHVKENPALVYYERIQHAWTEVPIWENHFFRLILSARLEPNQTLPLWLTRYFASHLDGWVDHLTTEHRTMEEQLLYSQDQSFDVIYLSDVTDILSAPDAQEFFRLCHRKLKIGGRLALWNNLLDRRPSEGWLFQEEQSHIFWEQRKISLYGFYGVYVKQGS